MSATSDAPPPRGHSRLRMSQTIIRSQGDFTDSCDPLASKLLLALLLKVTNIRSLSVLSALSGNGGTDVRQTTRRPATAVRPVCSLQSCVVCCVPAPRVVLVRVRMKALGQSPQLSPRAYTSMCQVLGPAAHLLGGRPNVQPLGAISRCVGMHREGAQRCVNRTRAITSTQRLSIGVYPIG